ncbi:hypothetical protein KQH65_07840 [archaeon]|nr:hypothetical protein [archaeon]
MFGEKLNGVLLVLILSSSLIGITHASIATSDPPTSEFMAENSDIIAICRVTGVSVGVSNTRYGFKVIEAIKGNIKEEFVITTKEGTLRHTSPPQVSFEKGQELLMYLAEKDGKYQVFFGSWGKCILPAVNKPLLDSLRSEYTGDIISNAEYLMITGIILASILLIAAYWMQQRTKL